MISNAEHNNLLNKYNRLIAENKDLREQMKQRKNQSDEQMGENKAILDLIRSLCEDILGKDRSEMVVGTEYSWSFLSIKKLITKARDSYHRYNKERSDMLIKIADVADERRQMIEDLQEQIERMETMYKERGTAITAEEAKAELEKEHYEENALQKADLAVQEAAAAGSCEMIFQEEEDITNEVIKAHKEAYEIAASAKITQKSIPISEPKKKIEAKKQEKKRIDGINKSHIVNLGDYQKQFNENMYAVIEFIGKTGTSICQTIENTVFENLVNQGVKTSQARVRGAVHQLFAMNILEKMDLSTPMKPKGRIVRFTIQGHALYKEIYKEPPEQSEWDRIVIEHDNVEHGYGIMEIVEKMQECPEFKSVSGNNRRNPITFKDGQMIAPDIIAQTAKYKMYIEYEQGTHTQADFNAKMNKFVQLTRFLYIITPSNDIQSLVVEKINHWVQTRSPESLKGVKAFITTSKYFCRNGPAKPEAWQLEIKLATGEIVARDK